MRSSPETAVLRGDAAASVPAYTRATLTGVAAADTVPTAGSTPQVRLAEVYAEEVARIQEQARADGYADGYAEGMLAADQAVAQATAEAEQRLAEAHRAWEQQIASALAALAAAAERLDAQAAPVAEALAAQVAHTAFAVAEQIVGRELAVAVSPGVDAVQRALALCPSDAPVVVRVNPADHAALPETWLAQLPVTVTVRPDPAVDLAGAVAEAGPRRVNAQIEAALARVREVLTR